MKGLAGGVVYRTTKVQSLKHSKVEMNEFYSILGRVSGWGLAVLYPVARVSAEPLVHSKGCMGAVHLHGYPE